MVVKVGWACGVCPKCGKTICRKRPADLAVCDCWMYCPLDGKKMTPYKPDLTPSTYESDKGLDIVMWHNSPSNHEQPYYSKQKPVEVQLS
ncbi:MAG: hypothetical protein OEY81_01310 [Candidatus Bathyarchaeota archaeon]|nr:hypothetical protein [Candidatus Bathyarchaeota archaeon]